MINTNGRHFFGKNTANAKTLLATLTLGASMMAANANMDYDNRDANHGADSVGLNHREPPPSGDNDSHWGHGHDTYAPVPESTAIVAASLLLLPLGVSMVRGFRRKNSDCR